VPLPYSWTPDEIDGDAKVCTLKSAVEYGDAREAAGRAGAVPDGCVVVQRVMLEQIYGMAREGCDAPSAAYRWCERIDEVFHVGEPSTEYAEWAQPLPKSPVSAPQPMTTQGEADALLREVCQELIGVGCEPCTGSDAPMEDLHGRIADYFANTSTGSQP